jgi:hypothetical protein
MKMSLAVESLRADVDSVAELGDETVAEVAERIAALIARAAPSRILDLLSEVAAELSHEVPDGHVEIRVVGDDVELAYVPQQPFVLDTEGDASARITLRLSDSLKSRIEQAATQQAVSVNTWINRALDRAASASSGRNSWNTKRLYGYGTS